MSFFLEDANGEWLCDLTNFAITDIYDDPDAPESLKKFMGDGEADNELGNQVIQDITDDSEYAYIKEALMEAIFPVIVTDGMTSDDEDDGEPDDEEEPE